MKPTKQSVIGVYEALKKGVFITATCLVIFVALRNSLMWHLEQFWGGSKNFWSSIWGIFYWLSGESFFNVHVYGACVLGIIVFIVANTFFTVLDLTGKPAAFLKYKIQEDKAVPISWEKYKKALWGCAFNLSVVGPIYQLVTYPLAVWRGLDAGYELPTFTTTVIHFIGFIIVEEIGFYYSHRLFHHPLLYKRIHKIHHEWTAPTGITSLYCHPVEYFVSNVGPLGLGPIIMGSHMSISLLWFGMAVLNSSITHSGYHFPFLPSPEAHDFHHLKFNQNYGVMGVLDTLHGTNEQFRKSKNYEYHILLTSFSSVKELFPKKKN